MGLDYSLIGDLDALLKDAVKTGTTQSAALVVLYKGKVFYRGAAGGARLDSIFDVASLTKVVATTPAVMRLVEQKKINLKERVSKYLSWLAPTSKRKITVFQLLMHTSGLHSVVWAGDLTDTKPMILERISRTRLRAAPGVRFRYSDVGYILLGELAARVNKMSLDRLTRKQFFAPLGMCNTGFAPPARVLSRVISPWPGGGKEGQVYDPLAARMAGVAGHAGIFSTADDLARFGQMMLNGGVLHGVRILKRKTVQLMTRKRSLPGSSRHRALGWDVSSSTGATTSNLSPESYGHTGFTGTSLWIDPKHQLVVVLLTNRTFFEPAPSVIRLRARVHDLIWNTVSRPPKRPINTGLDNLLANNLKLLKGKKIGLITNHTAVDRRGRWIVDLLSQSPNVTLKAIFAPEHGLKGKLDRHIKDSHIRRGQKAIPVYSLFGSRRRPSKASLDQIDTLVFDIAAVGIRYYTYLSTMGQAMEEAARLGLTFVVLDRPNPIGGALIQGPLAQSNERTSTNYYPLPIRYGMTMGELARMYNKERRIKVRLKVVPITGWRRSMLFHQQGLPWINPSPNIRSFRQALLYGGIGFLEGTNLAVGRGTKAPFQLVGAPWIDGVALAREINRARLPGIFAVPTTFTPKSSRYKHKLCKGVRLLLLDPKRLNPVILGITLASALHKLHRENWETDSLHRMVRHPRTTKGILAGQPPERITPLWIAGLRRFQQRRSQYLLYR